MHDQDDHIIFGGSDNPDAIFVGTHETVFRKALEIDGYTVMFGAEVVLPPCPSTSLLKYWWIPFPFSLIFYEIDFDEEPEICEAHEALKYGGILSLLLALILM